MERTYEWKKVILFGDSLTQRSFDPQGGCWGSLLADRLQRICDVICRGFSGYNSRAALIMLPALVKREHVPSIRMITIFFGANDACLEDTPTKQNIPLDEYKQNLKEMISYLLEIGLEKRQIILINLPPYCFEMHKENCLETTGTIPKRSEELVCSYAAACIEVANSVQVPCLDIYSAMLQEKDWHKFLIDGLHLSWTGGTFLADRLWQIMEPCMANLQWLFPYHQDLYIKSSHWEEDLQEYCTHVK